MLGHLLGQAMARKINRLNARAVATITKHGRHADGGGLYLSISPNGGRRWVFLFRASPPKSGLVRRATWRSPARASWPGKHVPSSRRASIQGTPEGHQKALRSANAPTA